MPMSIYMYMYTCTYMGVIVRSHDSVIPNEPTEGDPDRALVGP